MLPEFLRVLEGMQHLFKTCRQKLPRLLVPNTNHHMTSCFERAIPGRFLDFHEASQSALASSKISHRFDCICQAKMWTLENEGNAMHGMLSASTSLCELTLRRQETMAPTWKEVPDRSDEASRLHRYGILRIMMFPTDFGR